MKKTYLLTLLSILLFSLSCTSSDEVDLNGDWEVVGNSINSVIDAPIKRFRIENDSVLISTYRSYFDVGEGRIFKNKRDVFVSTGHEVKHYNLVRYDSDRMIFSSKDNSDKKVVIHKIRTTRESKIAAYLNSSVDIVISPQLLGQRN